MRIKAPDLGVESAEVIEVLVSVGDKISKDENIILLESDKASVEVPSSAAGKVVSIEVNEGDKVSQGSVLIVLDDVQEEDVQEESALENEEEDEQNISTQNVDEEDSAARELENSRSIKKVTDEQANYEDAKDASNNEVTSTKNGSSGIKDSIDVTFALPDLGVEEAQVAEVLVNEGDSIEKDAAILLIESDKASVEVPAPDAGLVKKILIKTGDTVSSDQDFIIISISQSKNNNEGQALTPKDETADKLLSEQDEPSIETEKDNSENTSNQSKSETQPNQTATGSNSSDTIKSQTKSDLTSVYAGPAVRKLARQLGVDITQVEGSATKNRILKEDVFDYVKLHMKSDHVESTTNKGSVSSLPPLPDMSDKTQWGSLETQDLTRLQKVSIPQLNLNTHLPQVTQFDLADITETENLRGELKADFKAEGISLTILAFIVKVTAHALSIHSRFNSHLSDDNSKIIIRKSINIGIAVATDDGLIVPVIKNVQTKGIKQIAIEIGQLAKKARDKKLTGNELKGASFTISSQGNLGGTYFTPLVNWPQVAILGVSEASMQPKWDSDTQKFVPRLMLPLSLSYDHRVINGADAAVFTRYIATLLADIRRILF